MTGRKNMDLTPFNNIRCFVFNSCGKENDCIGALIDEKCWTRAGSLSIPSNNICLLLQTNLIKDCTECSYYRIIHKINETNKLITELKNLLEGN
jgi:hypothetical protein